MFNCIGLDVSKSSINIHIQKNSQDLEIENTLQGIKQLHSKLKKIFKKEIDSLVFIFEPTANYSEALRKYCSDKSIKCFIINPKQFHNYAKALGVEVKNDIEDARVLAQAITLAKPKQICVPVYDKDIEAIKELMSYYKFTVKQKTMSKNHLESLQSKDANRYAIKDIKKSITTFEDKEKRVIEHVLEIIYSNEKYKTAYENILSIVGIGKISAIALLHLFIKYPNANQRQIISLTGLNPIYKESGTSVKSKYRISKSGSRLYRGSLFMGVMSAVRHDEYFKAFYERLKEKGKHTTVVQVALMRKLIIIAFSLYKNNKQYDKNYHQLLSKAGT